MASPSIEVRVPSLEIRRYLAVLRRRIAVVVAIVAVAVAAGWFFTPRGAKYNAKAVIYVGARQFSLSPGSQYAYDPTALVQRLMLTYADMLDSEPIADDALRATGVQRSASDVVAHTNVQPGKDTALLTIKVTDSSPDVARALANGIAQAFVDKVQTLDSNGPTPEGTLPGLPAYIFEKAKLPTSPISNGLTRNLLAAVVGGLLVAGGVVFLFEYLDLTIKNPGEAEARLELPVLGVIPYSDAQASGPLAVSPAAASANVGTVI